MTEPDNHLDYLQSTGLIRLSQMEPELAYLFRHALVQDAAYESLLKADRTRLHMAVGDILETLYASRGSELAATLAHHYLAAEEDEKAVHYLVLAGDHARQQVALGEAVQLYRLALARPSLQGQRAAVLRSLGECLWMLGDLEEAVVIYEEGFGLFEAAGDIEGAAAMQRNIGRIYWEQGIRARSMAHYRRALALLEPLPESVELARTISSLSQMYMLAYDAENAILHGERALALARRLEAQDVIVHALNNIGVARYEQGDWQQAEAMLRESSQQSRALGLPHDACRAMYNLAECKRKIEHNYKESKELLVQLDAYARESQVQLFVVNSWMRQAEIEWEIGQWRSALARHEKMYEYMATVQEHAYFQIASRTALGRAYLDLGLLDKAREVLEEGLPFGRAFAEAQLVLPLLIQLLRLYEIEQASEEFARIRDEILDWLQQIPDDHPSAVMANFQICVAMISQAAPVDEATGRACRQRLGQIAARHRTPESLAAIDEVDGCLAYLNGEYDQAALKLQFAALGWERIYRPLDRTRSQTWAARAQMENGDRSGAKATIERARSLLERLARQLNHPQLTRSFWKSAWVKDVYSLLGQLS